MQTVEISNALFTSPNTVKTHRKKNNLKLGIHNFHELILFAKHKKIINLKRLLGWFALRIAVEILFVRHEQKDCNGKPGPAISEGTPKS